MGPGSYICINLTLLQGSTSTIDPILFSPAPRIYPQTIIAARPPLSVLGSKSHPSMMLTLHLLTTFLLLGDDPWLSAWHSSQLELEMVSPESLISGTFVTNLYQCPPLPPRTSPPSSVHDLYVQTTVCLWKPRDHN